MWNCYSRLSNNRGGWNKNKKFGLAQNVLGPVKGQGISLAQNIVLAQNCLEPVE